VWLPTSALRLCFYAYASGNSLERPLADGIHVAAPWARVEVEPAAGLVVRVEQLSPETREVGIQGVRPVSREELAIYDERASVEAYLRGLRALPEAGTAETQRLQRYYRTWLKYNGTIARAIQAYHEAYFAWVQRD
jgi:hypothetical protein